MLHCSLQRRSGPGAGTPVPASISKTSCLGFVESSTLCLTASHTIEHREGRRHALPLGANRRRVRLEPPSRLRAPLRALVAPVS